MSAVGLKAILAVLGVTSVAVGVPLGVIFSQGGGNKVEAVDHSKYCPTIQEDIAKYGQENPKYKYYTVEESTQNSTITYDEDVEIKSCITKK